MRDHACEAFTAHPLKTDWLCAVNWQPTRRGLDMHPWDERKMRLCFTSMSHILYIHTRTHAWAHTHAHTPTSSRGKSQTPSSESWNSNLLLIQTSVRKCNAMFWAKFIISHTVLKCVCVFVAAVLYVGQLLQGGLSYLSAPFHFFFFPLQFQWFKRSLMCACYLLQNIFFLYHWICPLLLEIMCSFAQANDYKWIISWLYTFRRSWNEI